MNGVEKRVGKSMEIAKSLKLTRKEVCYACGAEVHTVDSKQILHKEVVKKSYHKERLKVSYLCSHCGHVLHFEIYKVVL